MATELETLLNFAESQGEMLGGVALGYLGVPQAQAAAAAQAAQAQAAAATAQAQATAATAQAQAAAATAQWAAQAEAAEAAGEVAFAKEVGSTGVVVVGLLAAALIGYALVKR